jgi:ring-1,2-phenylacetyl-CoA epoxidase subunit PaaC
MNVNALKELLYKVADDQLILGHRNSEWTGFGPILEEDIAFSSMAQDKIGHSYAIYQILHGLGEEQPDHVAFLRSASQFCNCQFVELPNGEYDFSLIRHFLFDTAEVIRFKMLAKSSFEPLAQLAVKIKSELQYHILHADALVQRLGNGTDESIERMQRALDYALPYALGIFEPSPFEEEIIMSGFFEGEISLKENWMKEVERATKSTQLRLPDWSTLNPVLGGRNGVHTEHLTKLLLEMSEVLRIDPKAEW